jgi:Uma2 family endonuclease
MAFSYEETLLFCDPVPFRDLLYCRWMQAILEPLLRSPMLKLYVDELTETLRREQAARDRFRATLDEDVRAEFINGEVVTHMPARDAHTSSIANIARVAQSHVWIHKLGCLRTENALTEFTRNDYGPDICFWTLEKSSLFTPATTIYPVPDFICEVVSKSTEHRDGGLKFDDYAAHGVKEYWLVDPEKKSIEQFRAVKGRFELVGRFTDGVMRSVAIAGFEMPVEVAFDEDKSMAYMYAMKPA